MQGRIHSIETMGLLDGPGVRTVVFMQGCRLRCRYCHNPDTWTFSGGTALSADTVIQKILRFRPYHENGGGVTFSGGEPLMQPDFLLELLKGCKQQGIHTCLDTAGAGFGRYEEILRYTDLVLLDFKHVSRQGFRKMTGTTNEGAAAFFEAVKNAAVPVWIRHVLVPGMTDSRTHLLELRRIVRSLPGVEKVELLPYHCMGVHKYKELGIPYPMGETAAMDPAKARMIQEELFGDFVKEE